MGVATVFQEFSLVPSLSVAENIHLGRLPKRRGQVDWRTRARDGRARARRHGRADRRRRDGRQLSVAEQQLVEIAKALAADASMIILDEPTTALGIGEIARLHALLKRLKAQGRAILYISHRLDEVVELVDCVTILKDGRVASAAEQSQVDIPFIVRTMVGDVAEHYPKERNATGEVLLQRQRHLDAQPRPATSHSMCIAARCSASAACSAPGARSWRARSLASTRSPTARSS